MKENYIVHNHSCYETDNCILVANLTYNNKVSNFPCVHYMDYKTYLDIGVWKIKKVNK